MVQKWYRFQGIGAAAGFLILILDSRRALDAARSGLELCIKTVIPSLFPFFVISIFLTNIPWKKVPFPLHILGNIMNVPKAAESLLIPSILGGYPVGAKCVADLYNKKQIGRKDAERLLAFSSNAGPSFLFGMVSVFFPEKSIIWLLWLIHIFSAVLTAATIPFEKTVCQFEPSIQKQHEASVIYAAAKAMCLVCCWVILFRMIISFLETWVLWILPEWIQTVLVGILELTNGCCQLQNIPDLKLRFIVCSCMLAFGGICVLFQTASVTHGLSIGCYIKGKMIQTLFSYLLSCAVVMDNRLIYTVWIPALLFLFRKKQKKYSNPQNLPV